MVVKGLLIVHIFFHEYPWYEESNVIVRIVMIEVAID